MSSCQTCGDDIKDHKKFCDKSCYGKSLSNKVEKQCPVCDNGFTTIPSRDKTYCSRGCFGRANRSGRYVNCDNCEDSVWKEQNEIERSNNLYCSNHCNNLDQKDRRKINCKNSKCNNFISIRESDDIKFCSKKCAHQHRSNEATINYSCDNCGTQFEEYENTVRRQKRCFCSRECTSEWRSKDFSGESNPRFVNGKYREFGNNWSSVRRRVWDRADESCESCGLSVKENGRRLSAHHIIPRRKFIEHKNLIVEQSNFMKNLIALCQSCHQSAEAGQSYYPTNE